MNTIIELFLVIFLWGNVWCVPATLAGKRRRKKKPIFLFIFISVLAIELLIAIGLLQLSLILDHSHIGIYASPTIASIAGGFLYWWLAERKDNTKVNQSLPPTA